MLSNGASQVEEKEDDKASSQNKPISQSQILANSSSYRDFHELYALDPDGSASHRRTHKCCVYIASNKYCARLDSIQAFIDINRDVSIIKLIDFFSFILLLILAMLCSIVYIYVRVNY